MTHPTPLRRRGLLTGAAAAVSLPRFAIAQSMPSLQTMRSTAKSWIWIAEDYANAAGFFTRAGVKVGFTATGRGNNFAALMGGGIDIVLSDPGVAMPALAQGFKARSFLQTVNRFASHVMVKKDVMDRAGVTEASPIEAKFAVLKGLRLGSTGPGSGPDNLLRWLAVKGGIDPNTQMRLLSIQGGGPGMIAGLQQNVIDGFCLSSPTSDLAVAKAGCAYLFNMVTNPPPEMNPFCYIIANASLRGISENREALVRYSMGIALALRAIADDPASFKKWVIPFLELDPSIAEAAFAANGAIYFRDPTPTDDLFQRNVEFSNTTLKTEGEPPLPSSVTFESMYDTTIVADALRRLG